MMQKVTRAVSFLIMVLFASLSIARGDVISGRLEIVEDTVVENKTFHFNDDGMGWREKGFVIKAGFPIKIVQFKNCTFIGDGSLDSHKGPVLTSESGCQVERFEIINCRFENLTYGANINCSQGGFIRYGLVIGSTFVDIKGTDSSRGKGLALALGGNGKAVSSGNRFIRCGRHGLYISNGGEASSFGDVFEECGVESSTSYPLAALAIGRGRGVTVQAAMFNRCRDAISLTDNGRHDCGDVVIRDSVFRDSVRYDVYLNGDNPAANGLFEDVRLLGNYHESKSQTWCAVAAHSFGATVVDNALIQDVRRGRTFPSVWFTGRGDSHDLVVNECLIRTGRPVSQAIWLRGDLSKMMMKNLKTIPLR